MASELSKAYDPAAVQAEVAGVWEAEKLFHAEPTDAGEPYSVVIPPPNVTAALHLGHALNNTIQDILIRKARMEGKNAVWIPGTDHAGIATQTVVEKRVMKEEGRRRVDIPREEFVGKIRAWKDEYEQVILGQLKAMGCSCDWDRTAFTMDEPRAKAVREAFFQLFKAGLIYRGKRLVNWDPVTQTALADDEVEMEEVDGFFYYLKYEVCDAAGISSPPPLEGGGGGRGASIRKSSEAGNPSPYPLPQGEGEKWYVTVATTRPETMLGDTAVALNPTDSRAAALKGKFVKLPIVGRIIPIIEDDYVVKPVAEGGDPADVKAQMATGFLKVTPAHDPNDYDIGQRHKLPVINVMAPDASISDGYGWTDGIGDAAFLLGQSREAAREAVVEWFRRHGLLEAVKPYRHSVGHSYRSHAAIEPYLSDQWYCRVTDDRLAGAALRAMNPAQTTAATSRDREGAPGDAAAAKTLTYLITFTTYGTWLHGTEKGSVHPNQNILGAPLITGDPAREQSDFERLKHDPYTMDIDTRAATQDAIIEVCQHRGWTLHALHVRRTHVHAVVTADREPERVMIDFKAYATRRLKSEGRLDDESRVWTRHGSTRYLNEPRSIDAAVGYVVDEQGPALSPEPIDERRPALPHGRGSLPKSLTFYPARYAKTYETWNTNIRDWCISRQLWWGHRIPVWTKPTGKTGPIPGTQSLMTEEEKKAAEEENARDPGYLSFHLNVRRWRDENRLVYLQHLSDGADDDDYPEDEFFCVRDSSDTEVISAIEARGWKQDPDVLDTWFSSGLWPLSTLGWPDVAAAALAKWNPTTVLTTAREIITLWVSRMVMFNQFFLGQVPFKDVFIHAMIQDGDGRKMSKSLGNGVDPLDIISSHGADAMRFTLASMCTQTQDVRMPVERDAATGKNTSPKFDIGRNFSNKVWNAARFVLGQIAALPPDTDNPSANQTGKVLTLVDLWILSRLNRTIDEANAALADYRFDQYAKTCYDFFWRDFCDWYVEAAKPQMKDPTRQAGTARVLASVLDASLRLMHPMIPFITEKLWWQLNDVYPERGVLGRIACPPAERCIKAQWPRRGEFAEAAEHIFAKIQEIVEAVRKARSDYKVDARKVLSVSIKSDEDGAHRILSLKASIEGLALCTLTDVGVTVAEPANAAKVTAGGCEVFIEGLIDPAAEQARQAKRREELTKVIASMKGRLANPGYVGKAPPHLLKQTQDQLAEAEAELAAMA